MARIFGEFVWVGLGLMLLACGSRTGIKTAGSDAATGAGLEPGTDSRRPLSDGGLSTAGSDPMGCGACARARVPGLSCVAGSCQQRRCTGPVGFRKIASYPPTFINKSITWQSSYLGADMNRDGRLDLLEFTDSLDDSLENPELVIWLGQGDGSFAVSSQYPTVGDFATPNLPGYAAVGDFNEDGLADLVVTKPGKPDVVSIRPGLQDGGLGGRTGLPGPRRLMADLDGDGHLDFITSPHGGEGTTTILVLRGRGNGTFASPSKNLIQDSAESLTLADWSGDGTLDLLAEGRALHILPGKGDGSFAEDQQCAFGPGLGPTVHADVNQDGRLDIIWAKDAQRLGTLFGQGNCSFTPFTDYGLSFQAEVLALGDLNGDGIPDLVVAGRDLKTGLVPGTALLMGSADGRFTPQTDLGFDASDVENLLIADVNGDGRADLVSAGSDNGIEVFANTCE
jgi:hypothetical protein